MTSVARSSQVGPPIHSGSRRTTRPNELSGRRHRQPTTLNSDGYDLGGDRDSEEDEHERQLREAGYMGKDEAHYDLRTTGDGDGLENHERLGGVPYASGWL
eukprot:TRINITY_DN12141_c1_g1_i10.p1 TRINITY_DN12141_c1_g1~~TRINITY_DN12141_c1_g1_i10.p1  ORF type:complete len:101 (+),score=9.91 TRINITY_DN12141_c1_g1_i10:144-446(+)